MTSCACFSRIAAFKDLCGGLFRKRKPGRSVYPEAEIPIPSSEWRRLFVYGAVATEMAISVGVATLLGYFLDSRFETAPVLTIVFMALGCVAGVFCFVKLRKMLQAKIGLDERDGRDQPGRFGQDP